MDDLELTKLCDQVKRSTQVRVVIDLCLEVEKRLAEKTLPEPKKYERRERMAKYMREWRAKRKPVPPRQARISAAIDKAVAAASRPKFDDKQAKLEALRKVIGAKPVEPEEPNPFE